MAMGVRVLGVQVFRRIVGPSVAVRPVRPEDGRRMGCHGESAR
jgi:hypothetical protein